MKHVLSKFFATLLIMVIMTLSTSCSFNLGTPQNAKQRTRHVWVKNVYYEQVYYIDNGHRTVVVSQKEVRLKKPKNNHDNGKHNNGQHY